jgi:hypothetical protein
MQRIKKPPSAPSKISEAPAKRVTAVNREPANGGAKTNGDLAAAIRARAYQIYEERGRTDGLADDDWAIAEREVLTQQGKRTT